MLFDGLTDQYTLGLVRAQNAGSDRGAYDSLSVVHEVKIERMWFWQAHDCGEDSKKRCKMTNAGKIPSILNYLITVRRGTAGVSSKAVEASFSLNLGTR